MNEGDTTGIPRIQLDIEPPLDLRPPLERLAEFAGFLSANGLPIDPATLVDGLRAARQTGLGSRAGLRSGLRASFTRTPADFQRFALLLDAYFRPDGERADVDGVMHPDANADGSTQVIAQRLLGMAGTSGKVRAEEELFGAGDFKALSLADFRVVFDPLQMRRMKALVDAVARRARRRVTRRQRIAMRGNRLDMRRTLRRSLGRYSHPVELRHRHPQHQLGRFELLLDISQSMDVYARQFLRFARVLMTVFRESYAFSFNTDLAQLGRGHAKLAERDFEAVLNATGKGWLGGTRIAHALETFETEHASRLLDHRTTLIVFSDGCDTAKPERLAEATRPFRQAVARGGRRDS